MRNLQNERTPSHPILPFLVRQHFALEIKPNIKMRVKKFLLSVLSQPKGVSSENSAAPAGLLTLICKFIGAHMATEASVFPLMFLLMTVSCRPCSGLVALVPFLSA